MLTNIIIVINAILFVFCIYKFINDSDKSENNK